MQIRPSDAEQVATGFFQHSAMTHVFEIFRFPVHDRVGFAYLIEINRNRGSVSYETYPEALEHLARIIQTGKRGGDPLR